MIYECRTYREFLKSLLAEKCSHNSAFSLRAFANQIKLSPSMLSNVLNGRKHLSADTALKISQNLALSSKEKDYFYNLVLLETAKSYELKTVLEKKLNKLRPKNKISDLSLEVFRVISDPAHVTILEMGGINGIHLDSRLAAKATGITEIEARVILERLEHLGLVEKQENGFYQRTQENLLVKSEKPNQALRSFHKKMLAKAMVTLETQSNKEKFVGSETFAFSAQNLKEAEELIEECFSKILDLSKSIKKKDAVYHLGIQLFNLTKNEELL